MTISKLTAALAATALGLSMAACGGDPTEGDQAATDTIVVGSAEFPENAILAEIYAQALEAKDVKVKKRLNIGAREVYLKALEDGEVDLIPEYSGNLLSYYDPDTTATSAEEVEDALEGVLPKKLEILDESRAEDKDSLNVTSELAAAEGLTTIADLKKIDGLTLGANPEFKDRAYGIGGLERVYGITGIEFVPINDGGGPATVKALQDGKIDVANIYTTAPSIMADKLVTLEDPDNLFAAQNVVPLINKKKASDKVEDVLDRISAELTTEDLRELNAKNQGDDKTAPDVLAKEWLTEKGLI